MANPYIPGIDSPHDRSPFSNRVGGIELRTKAALRMDVLDVDSGFCIAINGGIYAGSTVDECVRHIVTALVAKGLEA